MQYIEGSLPPGLTFNTFTGDIGNPPAASGTPSTAGTYTITVSADPLITSCANPAEQTNSQTFTIQIMPASSPSSPRGASNWTRQNSGTSVLAPSSNGWDDFAVDSPSVVNIGGQFLLYYEAADAVSHTYQIGRATSSDGVTWTKSSNNPVLRPGSSGTWDSLEVRFPVVQFDGTTYRMWYRGWDGNLLSAAKIGLATSTDGVTWTKSSSNPVFGTNLGGTGFVPGSVIINNGTFRMWYSSPIDSSVGLATSADGVIWTDMGAVQVPGTPPVSLIGGRPSVVLDGATYRMWFSQTRVIGGGVFTTALKYGTIAYATSSDGTTWTPYTQNLSLCTFCIITESTIPVLGFGPAGTFDRPAVGNASVVLDGTVFRMWYSGGSLYTPGFGLPNSPIWVAGFIGYATTQ
jgi:hypothetical protein